MTYSLTQLAADIRETLKAELQPGCEGEGLRLRVEIR